MGCGLARLLHRGPSDASLLAGVMAQGLPGEEWYWQMLATLRLHAVDQVTFFIFIIIIFLLLTDLNCQAII